MIIKPKEMSIDENNNILINGEVVGTIDNKGKINSNTMKFEDFIKFICRRGFYDDRS